MSVNFGYVYVLYNSCDTIYAPSQFTKYITEGNEHHWCP